MSLPMKPPFIDEFERLKARAVELGLEPPFRTGWSICIACGKKYPALSAGKECLSNHHCDPEWEARIEARRKGHGSLGRQQGHTFSRRLRDGFDYLNGTNL